MRVISEGPIKITRATAEAALKRRQSRTRVVIRDKECLGLALIVNPGSARWECAYRPPGVDPRTGRRWPNKTVSLGVPESLSPDAARIAANKIKGEVLAGGDPIAERRAASEARRTAEAEHEARQAEQAFTVDALIEAWAKARERDRRPSYLSVAKGALRRHFGQLLARPASALTAVEAVRILDQVKEQAGAVAANRALSYARAAYGWAVKRQALEANPFRGIERPAREVARDRVLSAEEVGAVYRAAGTLSKPYGAFVRVLLLSLQRREEVAALRWDELSADLTTWTLPAERAKNHRQHIVQLAEPVRVILDSTKRRRGCPYVFHAESGKPVSAFSFAKRNLDMALTQERQAARLDPAVLPGWTLHDFRRAGVTALADLGFPPHVADRLLNHVQGTIRGVAATYQRAAFLHERKAALEAWASHVISAADAAVMPANVVALRRA
jgi:integrase